MKIELKYIIAFMVGFTVVQFYFLEPKKDHQEQHWNNQQKCHKVCNYKVRYCEPEYAICYNSDMVHWL